MTSFPNQKHPIKIIFDFKIENGSDVVEIVKNPVKFLYSGNFYIKGFSTLSRSEKIFNTSKVIGDIYNQLTQAPILLSEIIEIATPESFEGTESSCFIFHCYSCGKDLPQNIKLCPHCGASRTGMPEKISLVDNVKALGGQVKEYINDHMRDAKNNAEGVALQRRSSIATQQEQFEKQQKIAIGEEEATYKSQQTSKGSEENDNLKIRRGLNIKKVTGIVIGMIVCFLFFGSFFNIQFINKLNNFISTDLLKNIYHKKIDNHYNSKNSTSNYSTVADKNWEPVKDYTAIRDFFIKNSKLKDPLSVQFRNVKIGKREQQGGDTAVIWCGEVNAKNSFGGYVGFSHFYAIDNEHKPVEVEPVEEKEKLFFLLIFGTFCENYTK